MKLKRLQIRNVTLEYVILTILPVLLIERYQMAEEVDSTLYTCPNTAMYVEGELVGTGLLSVRQEHVAWESENSGARILQYTKLSMHAVSRDLTHFPSPCILCLLNRSEDAGDGELEEDPLEEVRFVPAQEAQLQPIYSAIAKGQALHPDPEDMSSGDESGDCLITDESQETAGHCYESVVSGEMQGVFTSPDDLVNLTPEGLELLHKLDGMLLAPKVVASEGSQQHTPGGVGQSLNSSERDCCQGEIEEGQFDDVTIMDAS